MKKIAVGLYGINGHQIHELLENNERAYCCAVAKIDKEKLPKGYDFDNIKFYDTFEEMIKDETMDVISLCSDIRKDQEQQAIDALNAGLHVYSEKPFAFSEEKLDEILALAKSKNLSFHDMADTCFMEPFISMREIIKTGVLGEIVNVYAQKSYPYHDRRPQDDITDGGLIRWIGIHAARFIEHTTGIKIDKIYAVESGKGNPKEGNLCMASSLMMTLENGAVGAMNLNYLNQPSFEEWGNEHLRVWGTDGFIETTDGCTKTRLVLKEKDMGPIELKHSDVNYFEYMLDEIIDGKDMPISLEDEIHPLRAVLRAKDNVLERVK